MVTTNRIKPRVFIDADVLFAGSASTIEHGASLVVLRMAEITLIDAVTSEQVIIEVERNLTAKMPSTLPTFRLLVSRCLKIMPVPSKADLIPYIGLADPKDLPILVAAKQQECPWLVTFNIRHFQPGLSDVTVLTPGVFIQRVRHLLAQM